MQVKDRVTEWAYLRVELGDLGGELIDALPAVPQLGLRAVRSSIAARSLVAQLRQLRSTFNPCKQLLLSEGSRMCRDEQCC